MICCAHNKIVCAIKILHIVSVSNLIVQYYYKKYRFNPDCSILKKSPEYKLSPGFSCKEGLKKMSLWTRTLSIKIKKEPRAQIGSRPCLVPVIGVEPIRYRYHWILSPARLPIPSHRHIWLFYYITPNKKMQVLFQIFIYFLFFYFVFLTFLPQGCWLYPWL